MTQVYRGIPQRFRWESWKVAFNFEHYHATLNAKYEEFSATENEYTAIIQVDVPRTFPELKVFDKEAQEQLSRILTAYVNYAPQVGYCQGMNFVAGLLLLVSGFNEVETFLGFVGMMNEFKLAQFYQPSFPLVQKNILAFESIYKVRQPLLHSHFVKEDVSVAVFLNQWFLTVFVVSLPLRMVVTLWDYILYNGIDSILPISLGLLNLLEPHLIKLKFENILAFLKDIKAADSKDDIRVGRAIVNQAHRISLDYENISQLIQSQTPTNYTLPKITFNRPRHASKDSEAFSVITKDFVALEKDTN
ncbi:bifunctional Rab-GTPase-TBC domain superfamily/Rab-GTPase-TBC domain [Babesia duncani]|uniref:Bifunctional Rab-GTPase-TBC domain superfamily/Rab-GTPase-TBC domain n=1 Tax=Babesia duncani TaxID=323732 RepID=A0AAD9UMU2_9APIC|nr:bifunctional Rab-GTPase-TBC domain superfamily/Rab-GTPase-TBC domain [Babesia duncani]